MIHSEIYVIDCVLALSITNLVKWLEHIDRTFTPKEICFVTHWNAISHLGDEYQLNMLAFRDIQYNAIGRICLSSSKFTLDSHPSDFTEMLRVFSRTAVRDALCHVFKEGVMLSIGVHDKSVI